MVVLASDFTRPDWCKGKGNSEVRFPVFPNFLGLVLGGGRPDYLQKLKVPEVLFQTWSSKTCIPESSLTGLARASLPEKVPKRENEFRGAVKHLN